MSKAKYFFQLGKNEFCVVDIGFRNSKGLVYAVSVLGKGETMLISPELSVDLVSEEFRAQEAAREVSYLIGERERQTPPSDLARMIGENIQDMYKAA